MEENMKIEDVVNQKSKFETLALAESQITSIKKGEIIQFERRGFFICDKEASGEDLMVFNFIPDGKSKAMSVISTKVDAKMSAKGAEEGKKKEKQKKEKKDKKEKTEEKPNEN